AVEDELRAHPHTYDAIVLSTLPASRSRWIAADVGTHLERLGLPVIHVSERSSSLPLAARPRAEAGTLLARIPRPQPPRAAGRRFARPEGTRGMQVIAAVMAVYLLGSAALALTHDTRFFLNDVMALGIFGVMLGWQVVEAWRLRRQEPPR